MNLFFINCPCLDSFQLHWLLSHRASSSHTTLRHSTSFFGSWHLGQVLIYLNAWHSCLLICGDYLCHPRTIPLDHSTLDRLYLCRPLRGRDRSNSSSLDDQSAVVLDHCSASLTGHFANRDHVDVHLNRNVVGLNFFHLAYHLTCHFAFLFGWHLCQCHRLSLGRLIEDFIFL